MTHPPRSDKPWIPLIKAQKVLAPGQIPPLHSWKRGTGRETGWAWVQGGSGHCTESSYSHGWRPGHGKEAQPSLHRELWPGNSRTAETWARNSPWGWEEEQILQESVFLGKVMSSWTRPSSGTINLNSSRTSSAGQGRTRKGQSLGFVGCKYSSCNPLCIHIFLCAHRCSQCWKLLMFLTAFS